MLKTKIQANKGELGSSLIEVMVALLILAIGLLGVVTLQKNGLNSNTRAEFFSQAHLLAQDMADRIYAFDMSSGPVGGRYDGIDTSVPVTAPDCSNGCATADIDDFDQVEWTTMLADSFLPSARGMVDWNDPVYTVTVMWDQDRTGATGTNCSGNVDVDLTCLSLDIRVR